MGKQEKQTVANKRIKAPLVTSKRLKLKEIQEEDARFIVRLRSDYKVYRYFINPHKITIEEHLDWYKNNYLLNNNRFDWLAVDKEDKRIGVFSIKRVQDLPYTFEVSYILDPHEYGKGYAREAVEKLIEVGQDFLNCNCVIAEIHKDNDSSIKFIKGLGFSLDAKQDVFNIYKRIL